MRADLLALTPESLAALANRGLVKRAQKELGRGNAPTISEDDGGVVRAEFPDEVTTTLPPGTALQDADCSCGARGKCRHRVALVLAYQTWASEQGDGEAAAEAAPSDEAWSPGGITDEALSEALGKRVLTLARRRIRDGMVAELVREPPPSARLPTCTVRFLVPNDVSYAHCDCELGGGCAHVALAVWAFRDGDERGSNNAQLGGRDDAGPDLSVLEPAETLLHELLVEGVSSAPTSLAQHFARARAGVQAQRLTWVNDLLDDLDSTLEAYRGRSARYREEVAAGLLAEMGGRIRAARSAKELPPRFLLGAGEASETRLDHIRLVSLGARLDGDESRREATVWLADPDTATVLMLVKEWTFDEKETIPSNQALARRLAAYRVPLGTIATGQVVTRVARRRANRRLYLGRGSGIQSTSLSPQHGDFQALPAPVLVRDLSKLAEAFRGRPPRMLRPRILTEDFHAVCISDVGPVRYAPGEQALVVQVLDEAGSPLTLISRYRSASPGGLSALADAMQSLPTVVCGVVRRSALGMEMDPVSVICDKGMVVPDLAAGGGPESVLGGIERPGTPMEEALRAAAAQLDSGVHHGLRAVPSTWNRSLRLAAKRLEELGLGKVSGCMVALADKAKAVEGAPDEAARAWLDAAIRVQLALELI